MANQKKEEEEEDEPADVSLCCVSLLRCCCLFNWNIHGCVFNRQRQESALCFRSDADIWSEGCIFVSNHSHITTPPSLPGLFFFSFNTHLPPNFCSAVRLLHVDFPRLVRTCPPRTLLCVSPCQVPLPPLLPPRRISVTECAPLVVAVSFPSSSLCLSAWGLWDCGRAALPWQRAVLPNCVHLGFGVSLWLSLLFIPPLSQVFFWCSRGYQQPPPPSPSSSLRLHSLSPLKSTLTYVMRHTHLKTKIHVHTSACVSLAASLSPPPHFTFSVVVSTSFPSPFPCGGSDTALRDTTVPRVPPAYITVSALL